MEVAAKPIGKTVHVTQAAEECIHNLKRDVRKMNSALPEALKLMNSSLIILKKNQQKQKQSVIESLIQVEKDSFKIVGLLSNLMYSEVLEQLNNKSLERSGFGHDYVEDQIKERALARKNREFSRGDKIRSDLAAKGIALVDVDSETI